MRPLTPYELRNIRINATQREKSALMIKINGRVKRRKLHEDLRAKLIETVVVILKQGVPTHFEHEGTCRHGVRSFLCFEGWGWDDADITSGEIVHKALNRIGAKRPSWAQGQPEYRGEEFHGTARRCINPRCRSVLTEEQKQYCSHHCGEVVRKRRYEAANKAHVYALKMVYEHRSRQKDPEAYALKKKEAKARSLEKQDPRPCQECGKLFKAFPSDKARYCSVVCLHAKYRVNIMRPCETCGTEFLVTKKSDDRKFCSVKCKHERNKKDKERACPVCFTRFYLKQPSSKTKTCSRSCGVALARYGPHPFKCDAA